jgi:hypothetical protein
MNIFKTFYVAQLKLDGAIGDIDQGVQLAQLQVVNLNDFFEIILETQQQQSHECQTPIF